MVPKLETRSIALVTVTFFVFFCGKKQTNLEIIEKDGDMITPNLFSNLYTQETATGEMVQELKRER